MKGYTENWLSLFDARRKFCARLEVVQAPKASGLSSVIGNLANTIGKPQAKIGFFSSRMTVHESAHAVEDMIVRILGRVGFSFEYRLVYVAAHENLVVVLVSVHAVSHKLHVVWDLLLKLLHGMSLSTKD